MESQGEVIFYNTDDGLTHIEVKVEDETVWLTIDQMSELFGKARSTINEHILNIFSTLLIYSSCFILIYYVNYPYLYIYIIYFFKILFSILPLLNISLSLSKEISLIFLTVVE